jgi:hypothetical protein
MSNLKAFAKYVVTQEPVRLATGLMILYTGATLYLRLWWMVALLIAMLVIEGEIVRRYVWPLLKTR